MTYGQFKIESQKSDWGKYLFNLWIVCKAPLFPLIELFEKYQNLKPKQLTLF